ncbi:uncharacterized protein CIMG_12772 [Coccidioides immitis RS]|uniref:Uncharacterized protein n=1 Tax=Coccidioides immitis (strain RS) TaxID=246410 RepID=A0A0E1RZW3_COCIM|nr:uncharacterized protein CIMG_12772 [Coccidioides immitis RS]EAS36242.2 hypothetical protein CIMG_12772 [Coccidioides immitis RS]
MWCLCRVVTDWYQSTAPAMGSRHRPGIGSNELKGGKKSMPWNIARFDDSTKSLRTARRVSLASCGAWAVPGNLPPE